MEVYTNKNKHTDLSRVVVRKENDLKVVAHQLLTKYPKNKIFAFYGEMGAGKTTFIKFICNELNVTDIVSSPTFAIVNVYNSMSNQEIYHFDFYRMRSIEEAYDIGYEDYFYSDSYCLLEWPEKIEKLIPENTIRVKIEVDPVNDSRILSF